MHQALRSKVGYRISFLMSLGKAVAAAGLVLGLTACGGGGGAAAPAVTLTSIAITPASATIAKGATANLTATAGR